MKQPFDNERYKTLQTEAIYSKLKQFDKLYLEVGGKLFDDNHAARVLPGFDPNVKMQILKALSSELEIIFCINANDIISGKIRDDNGLTYADELLRLAKLMEKEKLKVCAINITFYTPDISVKKFEENCAKNGYKVYHSYMIDNYPDDIDLILSKDGFGKNDYIETHKRLVLVCAPGANSGKMQTALSQLYNDKLHGVNSYYAKYETFPVWNLPLNHLVNLAYEMATADLFDKNMIDPFHRAAYHKVAVNYNRDIEAFPVLQKLLNRIMNKTIYNSPTDMGINQVGFAINDDHAVQTAGFAEIERRYKKHQVKFSDEANKKILKNSEKIYKKSKKIFEKIK